MSRKVCFKPNYYYLFIQGIGVDLQYMLKYMVIFDVLRYIEIFPSNMDQVRNAMSGGSGGGRGGPYIGPQGGPCGNNDGSYNDNNGGGGGFNNRSAPYDARDRMGGSNRFNRGGECVPVIRSGAW